MASAGISNSDSFLIGGANPYGDNPLPPSSSALSSSSSTSSTPELDPIVDSTKKEVIPEWKITAIRVAQKLYKLALVRSCCVNSCG
ncbi:MAG TPA: hypothetical protein VGJ00_00660 [Rhabdochlamydiaceae bacterium]|jgi:hypothetical protein